MSLGRRVMTRRRSLELSQQELAKVLGVTRQHISAIEHDRRSPSLPFLARLAAELGVTIDYIVTGKESPIPDAIIAVMTDKSLTPGARKALVVLIKALRESAA